MFEAQNKYHANNMPKYGIYGICLPGEPAGDSY
jgi:hypothetical protein